MARRRTARLLGWALVLLSAVAVQPLFADRAADLKREIERLESEVARLQRSERTVLDQLERLSAELNLAEARRREVEFKRENAESSIAELDAQLETLREEQTERKDYLSFRLREVYKGGEADPLRRLLADGDGDAYWDGLRYAGYLNERDRRVLNAYRKSAEETTVSPTFRPSGDRMYRFSPSA